MAHDPIGQTNTNKCIIGGVTLFLGAASTVASLFIRTASSAKKGAGLVSGISAMVHGGWSLFSGRATGSVVASRNFSDAAKQIPECYKVPVVIQPLVTTTQAPEPSAPPMEPKFTPGFN